MRSNRGRIAKACRGVGGTGNAIALLMAGLIATGCSTGPSWTPCVGQVWPHNEDGGVREFTGQAKVNYSYVDAFGGLYKVDNVEYMIVDYNISDKAMPWYGPVGFVAAIAGTITTIPACLSGVGCAIPATIALAGLATATAGVVDKAGKEESNEDNKSARYIRIFSGGSKIYDNFASDLNGNNNLWLKGPSAWKTYTHYPPDVFVSLWKPAHVEVEFWADQRGLFGDTWDHRDDAVCKARIDLVR